MQRTATNPSYEELRRTFPDPPAEYGPIDCWWWEAGVLDKERMTWQLQEMKRMGVSGTWYYPRLIYGEALEPTPAYWTEEWWDFFRFSMQEHERLGLVAWTSDWTAAEFFQGQLREQREKEPWLWGRRLAMHQKEASGPGPLTLELQDDESLLWAAAFRKGDRGLEEASRHDLEPESRRVSWQAPESGWVLTAVVSRPYDLDYLNRKVAERWIEVLLGTHEKQLGDFLGTTLQAYGTDELYVLRGNILYSEALLERFREEKGYDPLPLLACLFADLGPRTDQIRCEFYDVMITMLEENLFQPFAQWLHKRGMVYTEFCPNGKWMDVLAQTYHYGDFFRYMRHYDYPGNEENTGRTRTFQAKMASSIAHLYQRKRTGLCNYWGAGWGHTLDENLRWTNENYAYGITLYNRHGVLYSTLGGWYEWVPPAVHFRQPYWQHWRTFTDHIRRLSYLLSQGNHVADVAILYPITAVHANWFGGGEFGAAANEAADAAYSLARTVYASGLDFDYIDFQTLQRAEVEDGRLKVSGLEFPVLLLPPLSTIRIGTLEKAKEFWEGGGVVIAYRRLPHASAENGRDDPALRLLLQETFGLDSTEAHHNSSLKRGTPYQVSENVSPQGGRAIFIASEGTEHARTLPELISSTIIQDVLASEPDVYHTHQRTGNGDVYFLFNARAETRLLEFVFRAGGQPEIWDTFTGEVRDIHRFETLTPVQSQRETTKSNLQASGKKTDCPMGGGTRVRLRMEPYQGLCVVFNRHSPDRPGVTQDDLTEVVEVEASGAGIVVRGFGDTAGRKSVRATYAGKRYRGETRMDPPPIVLPLDGSWRFRLKPTMDNRWGDFRHPASPRFIGAEARRFRYMPEGETPGTLLGWSQKDFAASAWPEFTYTHGPYWWDTGPLAGGQVPPDLLDGALKGEIDPAHWSWHTFSQKFGSLDREVQNTHGGLFGVANDFLVFDATGGSRDAERYLFTHVHSSRDQDLVLDFGGRGVFPREAWVSGVRVLSVDKDEKTRMRRIRIAREQFSETEELEREATVGVSVKKGWNPVLLRLTQPGGRRIATYAVFYDPQHPPTEERYVPLLKWFRNTSGLSYDVLPENRKRVGWYRFESPPGTESMGLQLRARRVEAWVDGEPVAVTNGIIKLPSAMKRVSRIALRVEHEPGYYAGAAFEEPVAFTCGEGLVALGDWCDHALESYSGAGVYTKTVQVSAEVLAGKAVLDLGRANATAEVRVNGQPAGLRLARPYTFDLSGLLQEGENTIEVTVHNTLANHYSVGYPSNFVYDGQTVAGLLGPVNLRFLREVTLRAEPEQLHVAGGLRDHCGPLTS